MAAFVRVCVRSLGASLARTIGESTTAKRIAAAANVLKIRGGIAKTLLLANFSIQMARTAFSMSTRSEEHTSELQSPCNLVCRLLLEKKKINRNEASPWAFTPSHCLKRRAMQTDPSRATRLFTPALLRRGGRNPHSPIHPPVLYFCG